MVLAPAAMGPKGSPRSHCSDSLKQGAGTMLQSPQICGENHATGRRSKPFWKDPKSKRLPSFDGLAENEHEIA